MWIDRSVSVLSPFSHNNVFHEMCVLMRSMWWFQNIYASTFMMPSLFKFVWYFQPLPSVAHETEIIKFLIRYLSIISFHLIPTSNILLHRKPIKLGKFVQYKLQIISDLFTVVTFQLTHSCTQPPMRKTAIITSIPQFSTSVTMKITLWIELCHALELLWPTAASKCICIHFNFY